MDGFNYSIKSIPTTFAGVRMRSRLEARWAAFFTNCGWRWTYEPFDADGWAPDFALHMPAGDIYVEVKPVMTQEVTNTFRSVSRPLVDAGVRALLVGSSLDFKNGYCGGALIGVGVGEGAYDEGDDIVIGCCGGMGHGQLCPGGQVAMSPAGAIYTCWVCGRYDGNPAHDAADAGVPQRWADACNRSQWRG